MAAQVINSAADRFAVAPFDTWVNAEKVTHELRTGSYPLSEISYLGLQSVLVGSAAQPLRHLPFSGNPVPIVSSPGPIADRLTARLDAGAASLQAALSAWLLPRHAAELQRSVERGNILLWVQLKDHAAERHACRALLAAGCASVGVHDLVDG
ncbi:MAG TPA: hypothetical protein VG963_29325 [Polyangiaceae bacterium]|jgi:hypothetical protein|nr:hypothetical protein [Polyangiaceae bacterium]HWB44105.1 hypothetical protein [Hyphomicrobiaceae bacterium]